MIAVISDFLGTEYSALMKAVILSIAKEEQIIELFKPEPHNIKASSWMLWKSYRHFPKGSVFLSVVDPGVGGKRKALAIKTKNYFFVAPDNGLVWKAAKEDGIIETLALENKSASKTFHGRDIFSKAAGAIAAAVKQGISINQNKQDTAKDINYDKTKGIRQGIAKEAAARDANWTIADNMAKKEIPSETKDMNDRKQKKMPLSAIIQKFAPELGCTSHNSGLVKINLSEQENQGEIIHIDCFGNIITTIKPKKGKKSYLLEFEGTKISLDFFSCYELAPEDTLFVLENSYNTLEIAIKQRKASSILDLCIGEKILLY